MSKVARNVIAVVVGILVGGMVNMGILTAGQILIPLPAGVDPNDLNSLARAMAQFEPDQFIAPFLAHALGTLVGAMWAYLIAGSRNLTWAYAIGAINFIGGVVACYLFPAPLWFEALDLLVAYFPMAFVGAQLAVVTKALIAK